MIRCKPLSGICFFLIPIIFSFKSDNGSNYAKELHLTIVNNSGNNSNRVWLSFFITNSSNVSDYKVITPGDGSESGWREPFIYFTAEMKGKRKNKNWEEITWQKPLRCGNYDPEWKKDTLTIKHGTTVEIYNFPFDLKSFFIIPYDGSMRLVAHYDFGQGVNNKIDKLAIRDTNFFIPAFHLISNSITIDVKK